LKQALHAPGGVKGGCVVQLHRRQADFAVQDAVAMQRLQTVIIPTIVQSASIPANLSAACESDIWDTQYG
jgi:hypothetical protein